MCNLIIDNYKIDSPIIDILTKLRDDSDKSFLKSIKDKGDYVSITCPFHKDGQENKPSCGVHAIKDGSLEYGWFNCFTCGASGPLYKLVAKCLNTSDSGGKAWLINNFGTYIGSKNHFDIADKIIINKHQMITNSNIPKFDLSQYQDYHPYMTQRKLSMDVIHKFNLKYDTNSKCIVFPVYDFMNNLVMLTRRSVESKAFFIDKDIKKPIYLLNYLVDNKIPYAIICESQINALYCHSLHLAGVATFGCKVAEHQVEILNKCGIKHFIIAFDGDSAGRAGAEALLQKLNKDIIIDILSLPNGKDLNDLNLDEIKDLLLKSGNTYENLVLQYN